MNNFVATPGSIEYLTRAKPQPLTTVKIGYQSLLEREVMIIRLTQEAAANPRLRRRFLQEVRALASLHHPNIVQVYESGLSDDIPHVVLEYLSGITLQHRIDQLVGQGEHMDLQEVVEIMRPISAAVEYAHQHAMLVYDLSPSNIVLTTDDRVMLAGLGQPLPENILTASPTMLAYAAPERLLGGAVTVRSDIYGLGVLLYHLLSGRLPFEGNSVGILARKQSQSMLPAFQGLRPELRGSEALTTLLRRALARQAGKRLSSVGEFSDSLSQAVEEHLARVQNRPYRVYNVRRRAHQRRRDQAMLHASARRPSPAPGAAGWATPDLGAGVAETAVPVEMDFEIGSPTAWAYAPRPTRVPRAPQHPLAEQPAAYAHPPASHRGTAPNAAPEPVSEGSAPSAVEVLDSEPEIVPLEAHDVVAVQAASPAVNAPAAAQAVAGAAHTVDPAEMAHEAGAPTAARAYAPRAHSAPPAGQAVADRQVPFGQSLSAHTSVAPTALAEPPLEIRAPVVAQELTTLPEVAPLHAKDSAQQVLTNGQKTFAVLMLLLIAAGLVVNWLVTVQIIIGGICIFYLASTVYKLNLIQTSLRHRVELSASGEDIARLNQTRLPIYTILMPLYKEAEVLGNLVHSMGSLDYPSECLDIKLLLEEDDHETIAAARALNMPSYFEIVVVPDGKPKGKPRACNYGLRSARGEYLVIYDAEDQVDPLQLKQALIAFDKLGPQTVCVQAKLNYYNQTQNLLTRLFTAEYSMWFDLFLPGLQALRVPIPLGGTSNHFRMDALRRLGGWDAWNVTEDADLGLRLFKRGFLTGVIDSTTFEEANSHVPNWIRQRSRWFKGYMQTWLVHMRNPLRLWRELGTGGFLAFQMMFFGAFFTVLVNPLFWILTLLWALTQWHVIEMIFVGPAFYLGGLCLYLGNFALVYMSMAGCMNRGYDRLVKTMLLAPFYWVLMSIACWKGFLQLITNPFYWEKTVHGLYKGAPHGDPNVQQA